MASALPQFNDCCSECDGISVSVTTTDAEQNFYMYDTVAALRAGASPTDANAYAVLRGLTTAFDGLGGQYFWVSTSTDTDDGVNWIKPSDKDVTDQGRWRKAV